MINRRIIASGLSIVSALAVMGGATFAFFTSTASSTDNVFASGNMTLQLDDNDDVTPASTIDASFGDGDLAPGDTTSGFISMHNGGNIAIAEVNLGSNQTVTSSPDLATRLNITSAKIGNDSTCSTGDVNISGSFTTLAALDAADLDLPSSALAPGATRYLCLTFQFDPTSDDTFQGKTITETFTFVGHQDASQ